jgi:hypothetical protein
VLLALLGVLGFEPLRIRQMLFQRRQRLLRQRTHARIPGLVVRGAGRVYGCLSSSTCTIRSYSCARVNGFESSGISIEALDVVGEGICA